MLETQGIRVFMDLNWLTIRETDSGLWDWWWTFPLLKMQRIYLPNEVANLRKILRSNHCISQVTLEFENYFPIVERLGWVISIPVSYPGGPAFTSRPGNCLDFEAIFPSLVGERCDNKGYWNNWLYIYIWQTEDFNRKSSIWLLRTSVRFQVG
jgi:hypothetical protein